MHSDKNVTAILVAYNSAGVIAEALGSLRSSPQIAGIIVVDNCSTDDTIEVIERDFPEIHIIENRRNDGFGRGNNLGLKKVMTPYALLMSPDAVMEEGALAHLLAAAELYPDAAILAPTLFASDGRLQQSYNRSLFSRETPQDAFFAPEGDICAEFLAGAVWLLNMKLMRSTGFFDPEIFSFYEDDDLCLRVRAAGHGLVLVQAARAMHLVGTSNFSDSDYSKQKHIAWSRLYLERKHRGEKAAKQLAQKLHLKYSVCAAWHTLRMSKPKVARYRGRIAGIFEFEKGKKP